MQNDVAMASDAMLVSNGGVDNNAAPFTPSDRDPRQEIHSDHGPESTKVEADYEAPVVYPSGARLVLVLCAGALSIFLVSLDTTIVSTAIPRITDEFKSVDEIGW